MWCRLSHLELLLLNRIRETSWMRTRNIRHMQSERRLSPSHLAGFVETRRLHWVMVRAKLLAAVNISHMRQSVRSRTEDQLLDSAMILERCAPVHRSPSANGLPRGALRPTPVSLRPRLVGVQSSVSRRRVAAVDPLTRIMTLGSNGIHAPGQDSRGGGGPNGP